ncbi:MAG: OmpA family protein [Lautropia sp.]|nr:OmpA family protein [Lautropia sp.]
MKMSSRTAAPATRSMDGLRRFLPALCTVAVLSACASTPQPNDRLSGARSAFDQARANTARAELSAAEMDRANVALQRAEGAWRKGEDRVEVDHLAYVAQREVDLAVTSAQRRETERAIEQAASERDAIQLEASRRRTDSAQAQATTAQMQATTAQMQAEQEKQRADQLAARLRELQAKDTQRGLVVTFSDVLFDVGRAELRSGALARVEQLAAVMREYPERNVLIEGFTDSTGSLATNQDLSERRAMSVRNELVARGIDPRRIVSRGHADRYPVADNSSGSGRQQNRRVEAVLSDARGELPMRP